MSHVDEGVLHAYLDGALDEYPPAEARRVREHLEVCAACRDRLEAERRVRVDAAAILDLAAPEVQVPTFEELRAYVRANTPRRSPWSVRLYQIGWAASVVLALGTGWILRGGEVVPVRSPTGVGVEAPPAQEAAASLRDERAAEELDRGVEEQEAFAAPAETGASVSVPAERSAVDASPVDPSAVDPSVSRQAVVALDADDAAPPPAQRPEQLKEAVVPAPERLRAEAVVASSAAAAPQPSSAEPVAQASPEPEPLADAAGDGNQAAVERRAARPDVVSSSIAAAPAAGLAPLGRSADAADVPPAVAEEEESYSLVVPNLEVLEVRFRGAGVESEGQVVLQLLESGDTLQVIHLPPEMDPSALDEPAGGHNQLVVQRSTGWIVMRAPLGDATLLGLMEQLLEAR